MMSKASFVYGRNEEINLLQKFANGEINSDQVQQIVDVNEDDGITL